MYVCMCLLKTTIWSCDDHVIPLQREWEVRAADKVDDLLESFMGIRDTELGEFESS